MWPNPGILGRIPCPFGFPDLPRIMPWRASIGGKLKAAADDDVRNPYH
jgi:hypothetical protein